LETTINPQALGFNAEEVIGRLSDQITIDQQSGYPFVPRKLALGWTKERIEMDVEARIAARG